MTKKYGFFIFFISILSLILISYPANSQDSQTEMEQILTVVNGTLYVKFITMVNNESLNSVSFTLPKNWNVRELKAYEKESFFPLNLTFDNISSETLINLIVNLTRDGNGTNGFVFEFIMDYPQEYEKQGYFYWNWGNASHPLPLTYEVQLPGFIDIVYINSNYDYQKKYGRNITIIKTQGLAEPYRYFEFSFSYRQVRPPTLKFTNLHIETVPLIEGENFVLGGEITNSGELTSGNITINERLLPVFEVVKESNFENVILKPGDSRQFSYVLKSISTVKNERLGEFIISYYDESGINRYESKSDFFNVTVIKSSSSYFELGPFKKIPINSNDFLFYIYNFILGYLILFILSVIRKAFNWNSVRIFDKIIYILFLAVINFIITIVIMLALMIFLSPLFWVFNTELPDWTIIFNTVLILCTIFITPIIFEKLIKRTAIINEMQETFWLFLRKLRKNGLKIFVAYIIVLIVLYLVINGLK